MGRVSMACISRCTSAPSPRPGRFTRLPGTQPLTWEGDLSERMMDGAHRFVERKIDESIQSRQKYWTRDFTSREAYERSVEPNRQRFMKSIGVVDPRVPVAIERFGNDDNPALVAETSAYRIYQVRWPVLENVSGEGLLLQPETAAASPRRGFTRRETRHQNRSPAWRRALPRRRSSPAAWPKTASRCSCR